MQGPFTSSEYRLSSNTIKNGEYNALHYYLSSLIKQVVLYSKSGRYPAKHRSDKLLWFLF